MAARTAFRILCTRVRSVPTSNFSNSRQISKVSQPHPAQPSGKPQAPWHVSPQKRLSHRQLSAQAESTSSISKSSSVLAESTVLHSEVQGLELPASTEVPPVPQSLLWRAFKWSLGLTATAAVAGTSYVTYSKPSSEGLLTFYHPIIKATINICIYIPNINMYMEYIIFLFETIVAKV